MMTEAQQKALWKRISELSGSQARIALLAIAAGDTLEYAIAVAETFPKDD